MAGSEVGEAGDRGEQRQWAARSTTMGEGDGDGDGVAAPPPDSKQGEDEVDHDGSPGQLAADQGGPEHGNDDVAAAAPFGGVRWKRTRSGGKEARVRKDRKSVV